jgi:glycosyltransferase involved in cell wall biosynthesis
VLHVVEALGAGVGRHVTDVVRHATGVRHEVVAGSHHTRWDTPDDPAARFEDAGALVHRVEMRRTPQHPANALAVRAVRRLIATRRPAVVHGHSAIGGAVARIAAWRAPVTRVYTPHGVYPHRVAIATERLLGRRTDHLIAVSDSERELVTALGLVPPHRIRVVRNGIEGTAPPDARDLRIELGIPAGAPLVVSVARLEPQKAPEVFVAATAHLSRSLPHAHFLLVGAGPLDAAVADAVRAADVGARFHRLPYVPGVGALMSQFDVLVLTSRYEGLPYVALEAMRAGVPVVATDVVGTRDAVVHGVTGVLVPPDDAAAVADAARWMLTAPQTAASFGRAGASRVRDRFDVSAMAAALDDLYLRSAAGLSATRR